MKTANSFNELYAQIKQRKAPFLVTFFVVVTITYAALYAIDFIPEAPTESVDETTATNDVTPEPGEEPAEAPVAHPLPTKIIFDSLDNREVLVLNPASREIAELDEALLECAVRRPDSCYFDNE